MRDQLERISKLNFTDMDEEISQLRISQMTAAEIEQINTYQATNQQQAFSHKLSIQLKKWYIANDPTINKEEAEEQITIYRQLVFIQSKKEAMGQAVKQINLMNAQVTNCKLCPFFIAPNLNRLFIAYLIIFCIIVPVFLYMNIYEQQHNPLLNILLTIEIGILAFALLNYCGRSFSWHRHSFVEAIKLVGEVGKLQKQLKQSLSVIKKYSARIKERNKI